MATGPLNAYLSIKGQKQGDIKGAVTQKGREGKILVTDYTYSVLSPRDAATGLPTGKRQHQPMQVVVPTGPQTP
jgi:type VI secretion system secreted protein Hcp